MFHTKSNFSVAPRLINGLMDDFFQNGWGRIADEKLDAFTVPVNISETDKEYTLQVVAPGVSKDDFKISIDKNILTISYSKKEENKQEEENKEGTAKVLRTEYRFNAFKRSFTLNDKVNTAGISAKYTDGILNVTLPKKEATEVSTQVITVE